MYGGGPRRIRRNSRGRIYQKGLVLGSQEFEVGEILITEADEASSLPEAFEGDFDVGLLDGWVFDNFGWDFVSFAKTENVIGNIFTLCVFHADHQGIWVFWDFWASHRQEITGSFLRVPWWWLFSTFALAFAYLSAFE